jgi:hypothetical protein
MKAERRIENLEWRIGDQKYFTSGHFLLKKV